MSVKPRRIDPLYEIETLNFIAESGWSPAIPQLGVSKRIKE